MGSLKKMYYPYWCSFQVFRGSEREGGAGHKLVVKMAAEPNRNTTICVSCGLSLAFNHQEIGL